MDSNHIEVFCDLKYGEHPQQNLDLYLPKNRTNYTPIVIYIHGGGWTDRDKSDYQNIGIEFAKSNICCAVINYRLSSSNIEDMSSIKHPEHTYDCINAINWIANMKDKYTYDIQQFVLIGHSAGAFMSSIIVGESMFYEKLEKNVIIKGIICIEGLYDLISLLEDFEDYLKWVVLPAFPNDKTIWTNHSPTHIFKLQKGSIEKVMPKFLVIYSNNDELVNRRQGIEFVESLKECGIQTEYLELNDDKNATHYGVVLGEFYRTKTHQHLMSFIAKLFE